MNSLAPRRPPPRDAGESIEHKAIRHLLKAIAPDERLKAILSPEDPKVRALLATLYENKPT